MENRVVHINFANVNFECPHCGEKYSDEDDKYLERCNNNKNGITRLNCRKCTTRFGMTYDIKGDAVGFDLKRD